MAKLTLKQQKFADEYIISGNATQSAIKAGYSKKSAKEVGSQNLTKLHIRNYIDERLKILEDKAIAKQDEVLKYLSSVMRGEHTEQVLRGMGEGYQEPTNIEVGAKDRIKAAELIGKRYGIWTDKQEIEHTGTVQFIDDIRDDIE